MKYKSIFCAAAYAVGFFPKSYKRVVPNKGHVVGKFRIERIGVWTRQVGTLEYMNSYLIAIVNDKLENPAKMT